MPDVQFDTDTPHAPMGTAVGFVSAENKMAGWLLRRGVVKSDTQALYILIGFAALVFAASIALVVANSVPKKPSFGHAPKINMGPR